MMMTYYESGDRFATLSKSGVKTIYRVNNLGIPLPESPTVYRDDDPYWPPMHDDDPYSYPINVRRVESTPDLADIPVAPPEGEPDDGH